MLNETQATAFEKFEAALRKKSIERTALAAPSGHKTLLKATEVSSEPSVSSDPPTIRDLHQLSILPE